MTCSAEIPVDWHEEIRPSKYVGTICSNTLWKWCDAAANMPSPVYFNKLGDANVQMAGCMNVTFLLWRYQTLWDLIRQSLMQKCESEIIILEVQLV